MYFRVCLVPVENVEMRSTTLEKLQGHGIRTTRKTGTLGRTNVSVDILYTHGGGMGGRMVL